MNPFVQKVALKSEAELLKIIQNPSDYQLAFLEAAKAELEKREVGFESKALDKKLEVVQKTKKIKEYQEKAIVHLPPSIKWAANLIYLAVGLRLIEMIRFSFFMEVSGLDVTYIAAFLNFALMIFIAWTIKKGRDIRKLMVVVAFFSVISLLSSVGTFLSTDGTIVLSAAILASLCEIVTTVLLYIDDSRQWYENEGKKF